MNRLYIIKNGKSIYGTANHAKKMLLKVRNQFKAKEWWKTLAAKLRWHFQYYGVSGNSDKIAAFYRMTTKLVHKWLNRRSQKGKMNWDEFTEYLKHYPLPRPRIVHKFTWSGVR